MDFRMISLTFCALIIGLTVYTQTDYVEESITQKGFFGIAVGPALPQGDFRSNSATEPEAGFAQTGFNFNLNFGYKFNENVGLSILWMGSAFPVDGQSLVDALALANPGIQWELEPGPWATGALMGGLLTTFPTNQIDIDIRMLAGIASSSSPKISITAFQSGARVDLEQLRDTSGAFAFNIGGGFKYYLSKKIALTINFDYFYTKPSFDVITNTSNATSSNASFDQPISSVNITAGIGFRIL